MDVKEVECKDPQDPPTKFAVLIAKDGKWPGTNGWATVYVMDDIEKGKLGLSPGQAIYEVVVTTKWKCKTHIEECKCK